MGRVNLDYKELLPLWWIYKNEYNSLDDFNNKHYLQVFYCEDGCDGDAELLNFESEADIMKYADKHIMLVEPATEDYDVRVIFLDDYSMIDKTIAKFDKFNEKFGNSELEPYNTIELYKIKEELENGTFRD